MALSSTTNPDSGGGISWKWLATILVSSVIAASGWIMGNVYKEAEATRESVNQLMATVAAQTQVVSDMKNFREQVGRDFDAVREQERIDSDKEASLESKWASIDGRLEYLIDEMNRLGLASHPQAGPH